MDNENMFEVSAENGETVNTEQPNETAVEAKIENPTEDVLNNDSDNYYTPSEPKSYPKHTAQKRKRKKNRHILKIFAWIFGIFAAAIILATVIIIGTGEFLGIGSGRGKDCVIEIEQGMSTKQIAHVLKEGGAINYEFAFRLYSKLSGNDGKYLYGVYTFNNETGYADLADMLMTQGAVAESVTVTIPEMSTIDDMAKILEEKGVCTAADFKSAVRNAELKNEIISGIPTQKVYYRLEGYLFPDTYDFYSYDSAECAVLAVKKMLARTEELFTESMRQRATELGYSVHEILTMASIVELEAGGSPSEMASVAQVFYNRLNSPEFTTLGSSPTRKYPYGDGKYNTYVCHGLPVGPLCAPSLNSIMAALYPNTQITATYFVTDASMNFYYNSTLADHNATIAKLKREKNWIYED